MKWNEWGDRKEQELKNIYKTKAKAKWNSQNSKCLTLNNWFIC